MEAAAAAGAAAGAAAARTSRASSSASSMEGAVAGAIQGISGAAGRAGAGYDGEAEVGMRFRRVLGWVGVDGGGETAAACASRRSLPCRPPLNPLWRAMSLCGAAGACTTSRSGKVVTLAAPLRRTCHAVIACGARGVEYGPVARTAWRRDASFPPLDGADSMLAPVCCKTTMEQAELRVAASPHATGGR